VTVVVTGGAAMRHHCISLGAVRSRLLARYYTGPIGHLVAGIADWAELLARWNWQRLRERYKRGGSRR
jgi:hypothetical protein